MEKLDLTYLNWSKTRNLGGIAGSFLKAYYDNTYYKLSNYDAYKGIFGHEAINEYVVDKLLDILNIEHVHYELINADIIINNKKYNTYLCASKNYRKENETKVALDTFYETYAIDGESPIDMLTRMGFDDYINNVFLVDFLIVNRDRHGANIEIIKDTKNNSIRLAPLFDHGLSLFFSDNDFTKIKKSNYLEDKKVQSFLGGSSLFDNLKLMSKYPKIKKLNLKDYNYMFSDLYDIMPKTWIDNVYNLINKRIEYYENFTTKKYK